MMAIETEGLGHFDASGHAHMVDVSHKAMTVREAVAEGTVEMAPQTLERIRKGRNAKGDVLAVAQVAGIMGAKRTADLVPLCHPIGLEGVEISFYFERMRGPDHCDGLGHPVLNDGVEGEVKGAAIMRIQATARTSARTGVEMEALTAVSITALTIYDMCKAQDRGMTISGIRLLRKTGGKSGSWKRGTVRLSD